MRDDEDLKEHWAVIEEYPTYAVSSHGRVRNVRHGNFLESKPNSYGYLRVTLSSPTKRQQIFIHQLVAQHFISEWYQGVHVTHYDGDNTNNNVMNLRFKGGKRHGQYIGRYDKVGVRRVRIVETGEIFRSVRDLARYIHGDVSTIYKVLRGVIPAYRGYTFEFYVEE